MPRFVICCSNGEFRSRDRGAEYDSAHTALALGVEGALAIVSDEIRRGERSAAVEIVIEREDGTNALRSVVSSSVSRLIAADGPTDTLPKDEWPD